MVILALKAFGPCLLWMFWFFLGSRKGKGGVPSMTALGVPQHKRICTIAFGCSTWTDEIALGLRRKKSFSLQKRERA